MSARLCLTTVTQLCSVVGKAKTTAAQSDLLSGIMSVAERIRQDAYNGDFAQVLRRHSFNALAVTGSAQQPPAFLCQPGSVLHHQICGI